MRSTKTNLAIGLVVVGTALFGIAHVRTAGTDCCGTGDGGGNCILEYPYRGCDGVHPCENPNFMTCCRSGGFCEDIGG